MRVLYIARELHPVVERKFALIAAQPDLELWIVRPRQRWPQTSGRIELTSICRVIDTPILYKLHDPHRTLYRTLDFAMRACQPDLIHAEAEPDSLSALQILLARRVFARRTPVILHTWQNVDRPVRPEVKWVRQTALRHAEAVLCGNQEAEELLRTRFVFQGVTGLLSSHGVNTTVFSPPDPRHVIRPFSVTYIGRLVPEKALDVLLHAFATLPPQTRLRLIGDGPLRDELTAQASGLGIAERVEFTGAIPYAQVRDALVRSSVVVLPSRRTQIWAEQFGRVLVEAMACGVPVVGSSSGAIPEVVGDGGLIFPEDDAPALAAALLRLLESPSLWQELGENGIRRVDQCYTYERLAEQTVAFYRALLSRQSSLLRFSGD